MRYSETIETWECGAYTLKLEVTDMQEAPNSAWGIWEESPRHIGGVTVTLPGSDYYGRGKNTFWTSCNYTPGQLAKEYANQGRENPSKVAYQSLQDELRHYVLGNSYSVSLTVYVNGQELASDCIGSDHSEWSRESLETMAMNMLGDYFDVFALCATAQGEIAELIELVA